VVLESHEAGIAEVGTAEVEFRKPIPLPRLDGAPEQHDNGAEVMEARIRTSVLVDEGVLVTKRDDTCDGHGFLERDPDRERLTETGRKVSEPFQRLWRPTMTLTCQHEEAIEFVKQQVGSSLFADQAFSLCAAKLALYPITMK
jgi:hypothetical protein